jgi:uncharacterized protein YdhG (YjbR/CyaY superfamily)
MSQFSDYMAQLPQTERAEFERICELVRRLVPEAEEGWSYGIPTFKYKGRPLLGFRAGKKHLSIFPYGNAPVEVLRDELEGFSLSSGTIRFTPDKPLPDSALEKLIRFKQREIEAV